MSFVRNAVSLARAHNHAAIAAAKEANGLPKGCALEKQFRYLERKARKLRRSAMANARLLRDVRP